MFGQDRTQMRRVFLDAWRKHKNQQPLEPIEHLIASLIADHPEYHPLFDSPETALDREWMPEQGESNPFLHLSMHIGIQEQVGADHPSGITNLYRQLVQHYGSAHAAEHEMMECLGRALWEAQRSGKLPDEQSYLECLRRLRRARR